MNIDQPTAVRKPHGFACFVALIVSVLLFASLVVFAHSGSQGFDHAARVAIEIAIVLMALLYYAT